MVLDANTGTGLTYKWLKDAAGIGGATASSHTASQSGSYRVIVTNANNCSDTSAAVTVIVFPGPGAAITAVGPTSFCSGGSVVLDANTGTGLTYKWLKDAAGIGGATASSHTASQSGSYRVIVTNANNCSDTSAAVTVTVFPRPGASLTAGGPTTLCSGDSVVLSANIGSGFSYAWQRDGAGISGASGASYAARQGGLYRVIVTNAENCSDTSAAVAVTLHPSPRADAGPDTAVCQGGSVAIGRPATGGAGSYMYSWMPAAGLSSAVVMQPSAAPATTTSYVVTVTDGNGCAGRDTVLVSVRPSPSPAVSASGPATFCSGDSVVLTADPGYTSYSWRPHGETSESIVVKTGGSYSVEVLDGNGCRGASAAVQVTVHARPQARISGASAVCPNTQAEYGVASQPGLTYSWTVERGAITSGMGSATIRVQWGATGPGKVKVKVTDPYTGCSGEDEVTVDIRSGLRPRILPESPVLCEGGSVELDAGPGYAHYTWSTGESTRMITVRAGGPYIVEVDDGAGCRGSDTVHVTELPRPVAVVEALGPSAFCEGDSVTLRTQAPYSRYLWKLENVPTGDTLRTLNARQAGVYTVEVEDGNGCRGESQPYVVTVHPRPEAGIQGASTACSGGAGLYRGLPEGTYVYNWNVTGGSIESGQGTSALRVRWGAAGGGFIELMVEDPSTGCSDTASMSVLITRGYEPKLALYGDSLLCEGDTLVIEAESGYENYEWSAGARGRTITVTSSGIYQVRVWDSLCEGWSHPVQVVVRPAPRPIVIASGPASFCEGDSVELSVTQSYARYLWRPGGETTPSITVKHAGRYRVEVEDMTGCRGVSNEMEIEVNPPPDAGFTGARSACSGGRQKYTARSGYEYTWTVAGGTIESGAGSREIEVRWLQSGVVRLRVRDASTGCESQSEDSVRVSAFLIPVVTVIGSREICAGDSVILRAEKGYHAYRWSTGESSDTIVVRAMGEYTVLVTDAGGCSGRSDPVRVSVNEPPRPVILSQGPLEFCRGGSVELYADGPYAKYLWSTGESAERITVRNGGSYRLTVWNASGCRGESSPIVVTVRPINAPRISGPASLCTGSEREYSVVADDSGVFAYTWSVDGGSLLDASANRARVFWSSPGRGSVMVAKLEPSSGCVAYDTLEVEVGSSLIPGVIVLKGPRICEGDTALLEAEGGYATYLWNTGDRGRRLRTAQGGSYSVTVTDSGGCRGVSSPVVVEVSALPSPAIEALGPLTFCLGDSVVLRTIAPYSSYSWSNGASTRSIVVRTSGSYSVEVEDAGGCRGAAGAVTVAVSPAETPVIIGPPSVCSGESAVYSSSGGYSTYEWIATGGGSIVSGQGSRSVVVQWVSAGAGSLSLRVRDAATGCEAESRIVVEVQDELAVYIEAPSGLRLCPGGRVTLKAPVGYSSYLWNTGETADSVVVGEGSYWVAVRSAGGCAGVSDTVRVKAHPEPRPDLFTRDATMFCEGDSALLEATAGYARYVWWHGSSMLSHSERSYTARSGGVYSVTVEDSNGCAGMSAPLELVVYPAGKPLVTVNGRVLTSTDGRSWQWYLDDTLVAGAGGRILEAPRPGIYRVRVGDANGCFGESDPVEVRFAQARCTVSLPDISARPGERVSIPLTLVEEENLARAGARFFSGWLLFDRSVLHPLSMPYIDSAGLRKVRVTGNATTAGEVVALLEAEALWGSSEESVILLEDAGWDAGDVQVTSLAGRIRLDLCREGGTRLYKPSGETRLLGNRPNPFNGVTRIDYELGETGPMELSVHDALGRRIAVPLCGNGLRGVHSVSFDAGGLPSGAYLVVLRAGETMSQKHILLAK